jgi:hypothetical protein
MEQEDAGVTPELLSFGVGLFCRMGIGKSRDGHAGVVDAHDIRIWVEREVEGLGRCHLGDQTDIRDARAVAMTEVPTCKNRSKPAPDFGRRRQVISAESGT